MSVIYKGRQSTMATKEGKKLFYPRVVLMGSVSTNQIAAEIAELSSLSKGDTKNVIDNLVTVMTRHLQASESVTLDGFGSFRYSMKATGNGVETLDEVTASQAKVFVRFTPASSRNVDRTVATRSLVTGARFVRVDQLGIGGGLPDDDETELPDEPGSGNGGGQGGSGSDGEDENPMG